MFSKLKQYPHLEVRRLKPTTKILTTLTSALTIAAGSYLGTMWFRTRKVASELRDAALLKHPALQSIKVWRRSFPLYASETPIHRPTKANIKQVHISSQNIPGYAGGPPVPIRVYTPEHVLSDQAIMWIHGGGYVMGTPEADDEICAYIARATRCTIINPEYRLAGTAPFPAALHDCHAAYTWMQGIFPDRGITIIGQSAGGGLAACLTQWLFDEGIPPARQVLLEPMLDDRTRITPNPGRGQFNWHHTSNTLAWNCYLSYLTPHDQIPDYAVASRRLDLTGLPPTFIAVGALDLFYEEALTYARRLKEQDVLVETMILPGAYHGTTIKYHQTPLMQELWVKVLKFIQPFGPV